MISKPGDVVGRDEEWRLLSRLWQSDRPELAFVVGRRRVGKSYLLARFARAVGGIYYQATRRTEAEQLDGFTRIIGRHYDDPALKQGVGFRDWEDAFDYLGERAAGEPLLIVLDEFTYLADAAPALTSVLQRYWDHDWARSRVKLILSGSYVTAMTRLEAADQPLYGRRTARLVLAPFTLPEAAQMMPGWVPREITLAYGIFGHLPGHLALLDSRRPLVENVCEHLLHPGGRLVDDAQHMLDAYLGETSVHHAVVEAIARGAQTWSGITSRVGRSGGGLLRPLQWLEAMGIIERAVPLTERRPARSKRALYRVTDPYLALWHRILAPLIHDGSVGLASPETLWEARVQPRLDDHMGPVFESICRAHLRRPAERSRIGFQPLIVGSWWDAHHREEVDVAVLGAGDELLVGEAKWGPVTARHLNTLRQRGALVAGEMDGAAPVHYALFTGRDDVDDPAVITEAKKMDVRLYVLSDLTVG